jgi:dTMP kinase
VDDHTTGALLAIDDGYGTLMDADVRSIAQLLTAEGYEVVIWDFQAEDMPRGYFVARYEAGQYGATALTNPYIAVLLYIVDYFDAAQDIAAHLADGSVVIVLNFATSVVAREAVKFSSQPERAAFYLWADQMLYETFGLQRPHKTVLINGAATEVSVKARLFHEMSGVFSRDYKAIDAYRNGHRLAQDAIDHLVMESIRSVLPDVPLQVKEDGTRETVTMSLPDMPESISAEYQGLMTELLNSCRAVVEQFKDAGAAEEEWRHVQALLTPMAMQPTNLSKLTSKNSGIELAAGYSQDHTAVKLIELWPKNEFDLLPGLLFQDSSLSVAELTARLDKLPFDQKDALLQSLLVGEREAGLNVSCTFELLTSYDVLSQLQESIPGVQIVTQALTPRYEYEMPASVEEYNLTDEYMDCFDKSMALHSRLESAQLRQVAHLVCLRGHKVRWQLSGGAQTLTAILSHTRSATTIDDIVTSMRDILQDRYPGLALALQAQH